MHSLAQVMTTQSSVAVLKRLATLAIELCGAGTGGVSVIEDDENGGQIFRWQALAGELERHEGGTTPRDWSPCGECLKTGKVMLYSYPARYFTYFQGIDTPIVEGLVVPMYVDNLPVGTIWILSHSEHVKFDAEDARVMTSLGNFAAAALKAALLGTASTDNRDVFAKPVRGERELVWKEYVRRIAHEDHSALSALLQETSPLVFATALRVLSFRADAEEVTTDVYHRIWRTAESYDPQRGSVDAWLVSIARSRAIDRLRTRATRDRSETALSVECSSGINPENSAAAAQTRTQLQHALHALPPQQQRAIELAYFSGLTMTEIAEQLGHPIGSVKTRIRMGLIKLRRLLAVTA